MNGVNLPPSPLKRQLFADSARRQGVEVILADRQADFVRLTPEVDFNLGRHIEGELEHLWQRTEVDLVPGDGVERGAELFEAHITELRLLYHFDRRSYLRAIVQHERTDFNPEAWSFPVDPVERDLFLQLLFSYKLNPRTLLLAGYSDSYRGGTPASAPALDLTRTGPGVRQS